MDGLGTGGITHGRHVLDAAITETVGTGPWGPAMDVILSLLPIVFLVLVTVVRQISMQTRASLPLAAVMLWIIRLAYFSHGANYVNAAVVFGVLNALTPLAVMGGAICLFETMEQTQCLRWIMGRIKMLTKHHPVAEVFLIGWAFSYMIEGASGFGTPVALAAPMLVSLGHPPVAAIACALVMNAPATIYGAVGAPIWFGLGNLGLSTDELIDVGFRAQSINIAASHVVPVLAASFLVRWSDLLRSWLFVLLSIWAAALPALGLASISTVFPSLGGGMFAVFTVSILTAFGIGLNANPGHKFASKQAAKSAESSSSESAAGRDETAVPLHAPANSAPGAEADSAPGAETNSATLQQRREAGSTQAVYATADLCNNDASCADTASVERADSAEPPSPLPARVDYPSAHSSRSASSSGSADVPKRERNGAVTAILRTLPLWLTVALLLLTRVEFFQVRDPIQRREPNFAVDLGSLAKFRLSSALVAQVTGIFGEDSDNLQFSFEFLYVPGIVPFLLVSLITALIFRRDLPEGASVASPFKSGFRRVKAIMPALFGALILVSLIRNGETETTSPAFIIGFRLANGFSDGFIAIAGALGALGSFFSGSTTVSNLTFGSIQQVAAERIDVKVQALLALQVLGAASGNMICINNIIAARAVVGGEATSVSEGVFIAKNVLALLAMLAISTGLSVPFLLS